MKRFFSWVVMGISMAAYAQVAINTNGHEPHASAMLDVASTEKGILIPRMTDRQMQDINDPAEGLLVYNKDKKNFYFYDGSRWRLASGDNLGDHKARQNLEMRGHWISYDGDDNGIFVARDEKVGIGRNDPKNALDVHGDIRHGNELKFEDPDKTNGRIWAYFAPADGGSNVFLGAGNITVVASGDAAKELEDQLPENEEHEVLYLASDPYEDDPAIKFITGLEGDGAHRVEAMTILGNGNIGIGTTAPQAKLHIVVEGTGVTARNLRLERNNDNSKKAAGILAMRSRGSHEAKEAVQEGDALTNWAVKAYDGDLYLTSAWIRMMVDGPVSDGIVPARIEFNTREGISNGWHANKPKVVIKNDGKVGIGIKEPARLLHVNGPVRLEPISEPDNPGEGDIYYDKDRDCLRYRSNNGWVDVGCPTQTNNN